ncbi:MAG: hypothetical protein IKJ91_00520 [Clostridia bacterium]|nr:hypothetical protein [Clostridia bacterium]
MTLRSGRISAILFLVLSLCIFAVLICDSADAISYMREGLALCARVVIPSLFPFMVLSGLFVELGCADILASLLSRPMRFLFGISGEGAAAPLMGALCGFPIGASTAHKLYRSGRISKDEMSRLLAFSNIPGSAFLISAVGSALWGNAHFGFALYIIQIVSAIIIGIFMRIFFPLQRSEMKNQQYERPSFGVRCFSKVISEASASMIGVCALVLFFASFVGALFSLLERFHMSDAVSSLIYGFFEMSGAVGKAAEIENRALGMIITALICGWSGLSIHFQIISICIEDGVSFVPYFSAKTAQALLSALGMIVYIRLIDPTMPSLYAFAPLQAANGGNALFLLSNGAFIFGTARTFYLRFKKKVF